MTGKAPNDDGPSERPGVFSTGARTARVVLVGKQRGDAEDNQGVPFVGPAGRLLHRAMDDAEAVCRALIDDLPIVAQHVGS